MHTTDKNEGKKAKLWVCEKLEKWSTPLTNFQLSVAESFRIFRDRTRFHCGLLTTFKRGSCFSPLLFSGTHIREVLKYYNRLDIMKKIKLDIIGKEANDNTYFGWHISCIIIYMCFYLETLKVLIYQISAFYCPRA